MKKEYSIISERTSVSWHTVSARIKKDELAILNKKLDMNGFKTLNEFVHAWIKGEYPSHENNEQVDKLLNRLRDNDIKDPLTGEFSPTFYRNVDLADMLKDLSKRYVYKKHAKDLVRYIQRYVEISLKKALKSPETGSTQNFPV